LDQHSKPVHADQQTVDELVDVIRREQCTGLLAVGSGTINDICKSAATITQKPLVTVATAASMNGYTSAISALTVHGLKITESCMPPVAIIADPEILATAPTEMNAAGFGDLLSKNASTADWLMSHTLLGEYYCDLPSAVVEAALARCIESAAAIAANRPAGLAVLVEALLRSGISMVLAGSSSPASGGEHLISHLWDMTAHWTGRTPALHGQQTGVTTLISLALYEKLLKLDAGTIRKRKVTPEFKSLQAFEEKMQSAFDDIADAVMPSARRKYLDEDTLGRRRGLIADNWDRIRKAVSAVVIPAGQSRAHLKAAGAVYRAADLNISRDELRFACRYARWIRDRYTVLDLAAEIGVLEEWLEEIVGVVE
jgi:glycerol-1-phosphate dehydrogenase [NAD(P)+]